MATDACQTQVDCWSQRRCRSFTDTNRLQGDRRNAATSGRGCRAGVHTLEGDWWVGKKRRTETTGRWRRGRASQLDWSVFLTRAPTILNPKSILKHRALSPACLPKASLSSSSAFSSLCCSPSSVPVLPSPSSEHLPSLPSFLRRLLQSNPHKLPSSSSTSSFSPVSLRHSEGPKKPSGTLTSLMERVCLSSSYSPIRTPISSLSSCRSTPPDSCSSPFFPSSSSSSSSSSSLLSYRGKTCLRCRPPALRYHCHFPLCSCLSSYFSASSSFFSFSCSASSRSSFCSALSRQGQSSSPSRVDAMRGAGTRLKKFPKENPGGTSQRRTEEEEEEREEQRKNKKKEEEEKEDVKKMEKIRNVGIFAHIDAGKTSTTEAFLLASKQISRKGSIDDGTTRMDFMGQERERGITIQSAATCFPWNDAFIQLIDTPGHVDFSAEVQLALCAIDGACVLLDASRGVEAQTRAIWKALGGGGGGAGEKEERGDEGKMGTSLACAPSTDDQHQHRVAKIIFVNKMDREGADMDFCLASIRRRLGVWPLQLNVIFRAPCRQFLKSKDAAGHASSSSCSSACSSGIRLQRHPSSSSSSFSSSLGDARTMFAVPSQVIIDLTNLKTSLYPPASASLHGSCPPPPLVYVPPMSILHKLGVKASSSSASSPPSSSCSPTSSSEVSSSPRSSPSSSLDSFPQERRTRTPTSDSDGSGGFTWAWWEDTRVLADVEARRDQLLEELALLDDRFDRESFSREQTGGELETGKEASDAKRTETKTKIKVEDIWAAARRIVLRHQAVPVLFGSAILNRGITQLLDAVDLLLPSPLDRPLLSAAPPSPLAASAYLRGIHKRQQSSPITTTTTNNSTALASAASISEARSKSSAFSSSSSVPTSCLSPCGRFLLRHRSAAPACVAFKVYPDGKGGRIAYVRVLSGQITPRTPLFNSTKATYEGCCPSSSIHLYRVKADVYEAVKQLESGDIGAIRGLKFTTAGDLLHLGCPVRLSSSFLLPALSAFDDGSSTSEDFFFPDSSSSPPPSSPFLPAGTREGSAHKPLLSSSSTEEGGKKEIALRPGDCPSQNRETHAGLRKSGDFTADTLRESREKDKNAENESPVLAQSSAPSLQERPPQQHHGFPRLYRRRRSGSRGMQILPVCFSSLECASAREEEQVEAALAAASLSDVALRYTRDEGGKFTLWGMGQLHLQVIQATLREQFGISTAFGPVEVGYREYLLRPVRGSLAISSSSSSLRQRCRTSASSSASSSSSSSTSFCVTISLSPLPLVPPEQRLAAFLNRKPDPACLLLADTAETIVSSSAWGGFISAYNNKKSCGAATTSTTRSAPVSNTSVFSSSFQHATDVFFSLSPTAMGQLQALDEGETEKGRLAPRQKGRHRLDENVGSFMINHDQGHHYNSHRHPEGATLHGRHGLAVFQAIQQAVHHAICAGPLLSYPLDLVHVCLESVSHDGYLQPAAAAGACAQLLRLLLRTGKGQKMLGSTSRQSSEGDRRTASKTFCHSRLRGRQDEEEEEEEEETEEDGDGPGDGGEAGEEEDVRERAGLLEPVMHLEICSPAKCLGPLLRDLSQQRRANVVSITAAGGSGGGDQEGEEEEEEGDQEGRGGGGEDLSGEVTMSLARGGDGGGAGVDDALMEVHATVPLRCMEDYSSVLRALSHGQAHFQLRPVGYGRVSPIDEEVLLKNRLAYDGQPFMFSKKNQSSLKTNREAA